MTVRIGALIAEDIPDVARLHGEAFPGFFLSRLGTPFLRQFYAGFLVDPSSVTAVARSDLGEILGAAVGTTDPPGFFRRLLRRQLVGLALASVRAAMRQPSSVPRLVRAIRYRGDGGSTEGAALLSSIFVVPAAQARGVGSDLLTAWAKEASGRGAHEAFLTTDAEGNDRVNRFYSAHGWRVAGTSRTPEGRLMNRYAITLDED